MKANRDVLEGQLERYEQQLRSLNSYIKELKDRTTQHGTEKEHYESDLAEAENNVLYYESEIARIKQELGASSKWGGSPTGVDSVLPRTAKQGLGSFIISSISFVAGALIGSRLKSRKSNRGEQEGKG